MAFFKFRKGGREQPAPTSAPESIDTLRKRAKHRLIGAAILVLAGVIGFPLLFDNQPRPIAVDIAIEIPDRAKVKPITNVPVVKPAVPVKEIAVPAPASVPTPTPTATPAPAPATETATAAPTGKPDTKPAEKPTAKVAEKASTNGNDKAKPDDGVKIQALLEGKDPAKEPAASAGRFVVQIGAFADVAKAREARLKLERARLKTYTQVVQTTDGRRIRVRLGPFATKHDADLAAEKVKKLNLPAAILEL